MQQSIRPTVTRQQRLDGLNDDHVFSTLVEHAIMSGDECIDQMHRLLRRITPARFEKSVKLIEAIRYFGGCVRFMHLNDLDEEDLEYCWCYTDECGTGTLGTYNHNDAWVTIPLDRHKGWGTVETTLRHELIHLLQDVTDTSYRTEDRDLPLLSSKMQWGDWLTQICLEEHDRQQAFADSDEDVTPLCELEAHTIDNWVRTVEDWTEEVKTRELWAGNWYCPLS